MRSRFLRARLGNPPARAIHDAVQLLFIALDARGVQDKYSSRECGIGSGSVRECGFDRRAFLSRVQMALRDARYFNPQTRWSQKMDTSRRKLLAGAGGLSLGAAVSAVQPRQATAKETSSVASSEGGEELVAVAVNDALEGAYGRHKGKRRNHTKGFGTTGYVVGAKEAARLSQSALFDGDRIEVIGRFSISGGDTTASDSEPGPRGMRPECRLRNGSVHHITMIHTPMFFARTPSTFLDKF